MMRFALQLEALPELFYTAKQLADFVIPQEYGMTVIPTLRIRLQAESCLCKLEIPRPWQ